MHHAALCVCMLKRAFMSLPGDWTSPNTKILTFSSHVRFFKCC